MGQCSEVCAMAVTVHKLSMFTFDRTHILQPEIAHLLKDCFESYIGSAPLFAKWMDML